VGHVEFMDRIRSFASHLGLCSALLSGISGAAMFSFPAVVGATLENNTGRVRSADAVEAPLRWADSLLGVNWAASLGPSLFVGSFFCSIQGLMTSTHLIGFVNCSPTADVCFHWARWAGRSASLGAWMMAPGVALLGAGMVCVMDQVYGGKTSSFALACFVALGVCTCGESALVLSSTHAIRHKLAQSSMR